MVQPAMEEQGSGVEGGPFGRVKRWRLIGFEGGAKVGVICWGRWCDSLPRGTWSGRFGKQQDGFHLRHGKFEVYSSGEPSGREICLGVTGKRITEDNSGE